MGQPTADELARGGRGETRRRGSSGAGDLTLIGRMDLGQFYQSIGAARRKVGGQRSIRSY